MVRPPSLHPLPHRPRNTHPGEPPCRARGRAAALLLAAIACAAPAGAAAPRGEPPANRGALLYDTHCTGCPTAQAHWRDRRLVTDWTSLREQVRRWQDLQRLNWSEEDITQVARHLNARFYRVRETGDRGPAADAGPAGSAAPVPSRS